MDFVSWNSLNNFSRAEFACKCGSGKCEAVPMDYHFMKCLQALRTHIGEPFTVTSGYRCTAYEAAIGGSGKNHPKGMAVDINTSKAAASKIVVLANRYGFTGIGAKLSGDNKDRFIHLDTTHQHLTVWTYP